MFSELDSMFGVQTHEPNESLDAEPLSDEVELPKQRRLKKSEREVEDSDDLGDFDWEDLVDENTNSPRMSDEDKEINKWLDGCAEHYAREEVAEMEKV